MRGETATGESPDPATYDTAIAEGKRRLMSATVEFVRRIEQRLERDRKRLQDYYRALLREVDGLEASHGGSPFPGGGRGKKAGC